MLLETEAALPERLNYRLHFRKQNYRWAFGRLLKLVFQIAALLG